MQTAAIFAHRILNNGEPQTRSGLCFIDAAAAFKGCFNLVCLKPRPIVLNDDFKLPLLAGDCRKADSDAFAPPFTGIFEKIADDFLQIFPFACKDGTGRSFLKEILKVGCNFAVTRCNRSRTGVTGVRKTTLSRCAAMRARCR